MCLCSKSLCFPASGSQKGHMTPVPLPPPHLQMPGHMPPPSMHGNGSVHGNNQVLEYLESQVRGMDVNSPLLQPQLMPPPPAARPAACALLRRASQHALWPGRRSRLTQAPARITRSQVTLQRRVCIRRPTARRAPLPSPAHPAQLQPGGRAGQPEPVRRIPPSLPIPGRSAGPGSQRSGPAG